MALRTPVEKLVTVSMTVRNAVSVLTLALVIVAVVVVRKNEVCVEEHSGTVSNQVQLVVIGIQGTGTVRSDDSDHLGSSRGHHEGCSCRGLRWVVKYFPTAEEQNSTPSENGS